MARSVHLPDVQDRAQAAFLGLVLLLVPAAFVVAHLVLLPIYTERYFAYPASLILLWVILMMSRSGGLPAVGGEAARY